MKCIIVTSYNFFPTHPETGLHKDVKYSCENLGFDTAMDVTMTFGMDSFLGLVNK